MPNPEKPENLRARQARFCQKMHAKGMVKIAFWVKKELSEHIKKYVDSLKNNY